MAVDPAWRGRSQKRRGWGARWWASGAMAVPCADPTVAAVLHPEAGGGRNIAEVVARGVWRWREEAAAAAIPRVDLAADGCDFYSLFFRFFFACGRHKHPHAENRFFRAGAPPAWKNWDFHKSFQADGLKVRTRKSLLIRLKRIFSY